MVAAVATASMPACAVAVAVQIASKWKSPQWFRLCHFCCCCRCCGCLRPMYRIHSRSGVSLARNRWHLQLCNAATIVALTVRNPCAEHKLGEKQTRDHKRILSLSLYLSHYNAVQVNAIQRTVHLFALKNEMRNALHYIINLSHTCFLFIVSIPLLNNVLC